MFGNGKIFTVDQLMPLESEVKSFSDVTFIPVTKTGCAQLMVPKFKNWSVLRASVVQTIVCRDEISESVGQVLGPADPLGREWVFGARVRSHTKPGDSGSPVLTHGGQVVGVHVGNDGTSNIVIALDPVIRILFKEKSVENTESARLDFDSVWKHIDTDTFFSSKGKSKRFAEYGNIKVVLDKSGNYTFNESEYVQSLLDNEGWGDRDSDEESLPDIEFESSTTKHVADFYQAPKVRGLLKSPGVPLLKKKIKDSFSTEHSPTLQKVEEPVNESPSPPKSSPPSLTLENFAILLREAQAHFDRLSNSQSVKKQQNAPPAPRTSSNNTTSSRRTKSKGSSKH
jgi:hypothetical protein